MRAVAVVTMLLTAACGGGVLYQTYAGTVPTAPDATYACVTRELASMGYRRLQYDSSELWILGSRTLQEQNSSGLYRKSVENLDVKVKADASGNSALTIGAHSYAEYSNQRGVDTQEQKASEAVKRDAQLLARACSGTQP